MKKIYFCSLILIFTGYNLLGQDHYVCSYTYDYDNDGDLDIVAALTSFTPEESGIYWLENDEGKMFNSKHLIINSDISYRIEYFNMVDYDADGDLDYIICENGWNDGSLVIYQQNHNNAFNKIILLEEYDFTMSKVADFNNDGFIDIIGVGDNNTGTRMYFNNSNIDFSEVILSTDYGGVIDAKDIDNDGDTDIAVGGSGVYNDGARILSNDGAGSFDLISYLASYTINHHSIWEDIEIADYHGDNSMDVLGFSSDATGGLWYYQGPSYGSGSIFVLDRDGVDIGGDILLFDVDKNGYVDIVRQEKGKSKVDVLYNYQASVWPQKEVISTEWEGEHERMSFGDLDNDGDEDLVLPSEAGISWFENIDGHLIKYVGNTTNILTKNSNQILECYPNPVNDILHIRMKDNNSIRIKVYNIQRTIVYEEIINRKSNLEINLSSLQSGFYIVEISDFKSNISVGKVFKK
ncbi:T9SS type A sorting domain-containing protein [Saccharicrinis sp. GN24d3]|uniref:T9SS type A sorting domain-containing protein n=1 Tax=Saccharicrinis sp. GN24d3 TaxID=3458416 RepID=UPI0040368C4B